jgi:hypothetical protein
VERAAYYKRLITDKNAKPSDFDRIIIHLIDLGQIGFINAHIQSIAEQTSTPIRTMNLLRNNGIDISKYIPIINERKLDIICELSSQIPDIDVSESRDSLETITMLVDEVLKPQKLQFSDLQFISKGGYSCAFIAGDKVIKFGLPQAKYSIPRNSKRFIQPLVRHHFDIISQGKPSKLSFEITELCDTQTEVSKEELYQIYKDVRDQGMVWGDCHYVNVGRLKKDNIVHHPSIKGVKKAHHTNVGIEEANDVEVLPAGELVILDLDFIFDESDPKLAQAGLTSIEKEFEERYRREKVRKAIDIEKTPEIEPETPNQNISGDERE